MKKFKNKLFYLYSCLIYFVLAIVTFVLSAIYLEPNIKAFFIDNFSSKYPGSSNIVEVIIDDATIEKYPQPWPRYMYTELLDFFTTYAKVKLVGYDFLPKDANPMIKADVDFVNQLAKMDNLVAGFTPESGNVSENDTVFMKKFREKYALSVDYRALDIPAQYQTVSQLSDRYLNASKNLASVKITGNASSGYVFSSINVIKIADSYYPSLPLKMYLVEHDTNDIIIDDYNIIVPKTGLKIPHKLITDSIIETDINYYGNHFIKQDSRYIPTSYTHPNVISARYIIDSYRNLKSGKPQPNDLNPEHFKDTVVFIGTNISGPSADVLKTPKSERHPGVDIQASMYDNLQNGKFLHNAGWQVQFLSIILLSLFTFIFILKYRFIKSLLLVLAINLLYFMLVAFSASNGYMLSFINPVAVQLITLIFGYSFKFITESRNKEKIKQAMGKYLSQDIMKNVVSNIDDLKLGGKRAVVTVLFSDIRGFTSLSEKMSAEEVSMILNEYFAEMEPIITKYNGVINKFIGDAVMALFGEPIQDMNHAQNAVKCAYEMLKKVEYLQEKWLFEGKPKIEIGVGINTGEVFIGNIGTETRMEYTVIGDTVNLASRIESYNKVYKTNLLVSSSTYQAISDIADVIKISEVQIRGKAKKMNIYEVLRISVDK